MDNLEGILRSDKIKDYRERIKHNFSSRFFNNVTSFCKRFKIFNLLFEDIIVKGQENVRKVKDKQLFYISNHLSMTDFLVQGYAFWEEELPIPRFIAGENLNHPLFKTFWKKCGAISVDRTIKDRDYWRVFDKEIKNYFFIGENLLDYAEGGRNYSGSGIKKFKTGIFNPLIEAVENGKDIWAVPVYIYYDKRVEEKFFGKVQMWKEKRDRCSQKGNHLRAWGCNKIYFGYDLLAFFYRPSEKKKGNAYVTFGETFSIKEFLRSIEKNKKVALSEKFRQEIVRLGLC